MTASPDSEPGPGPDAGTGTLTSPSVVPLGERVDGLPEPIVIRQLYLGCLSQASYLVGDASTGRAIAVDPRRDVEEMLGAARAEGVTIELIVQTHFHADFLSGHLELAEATGAPIAYGPGAVTEFPSRRLADGEVIDLGRVSVEVLHTPGHTPESISLVVAGPDGDPAATLTGDTLFIGDVGRPDLLVSAGSSAEDLGGRLYDSVHRLLELPDDVVVLPAHGAGSACGKALSSETISSIGEQRATNGALRPMTRDAFVALVTEDQPAAPGYFSHAAARNREDRPLAHDDEPLPILSLEQIDAAVEAGAVVVDVRPVEDVAGGHLAGSLNVSLGGRFAEQVGSIVPVGRPLVLIGSVAAVHEARVRLSRIGFDDVIGQVDEIGSILAERPDRSARLSRLTPSALAERQATLGDQLQLIDVRNPAEVHAAPVPGAEPIPLARLRDRAPSLDPDRPTVLVCAGGARSAIASTLLRSLGFADVSDVLGGAAALGVTEACATGRR
jgi:glyoxylase-like metal-dependent hydrolase (beta-lactamase superfamily II)/rhodanese-related sulfurtransferase